MNWERYLVQEHDLQVLITQNQPIAVSNAYLTANSGVELYTETGKQYNAIYDARLKAIRRLNTYNPQFQNMPNRDLMLYNDHLLNPDINTIIVDGFFGTGKTSTACSHLVSGLQKELAGKNGIPMAYISKPHISVGNSYGHLPGDLHEKMLKEFQSYIQYFDRFGNVGLADYLMMANIDHEYQFIKDKHQRLHAPMLEMLAFEYLRGRDVEEGWIILDETQNTSPAEISTFISRPTDKVKAIIMGDSTFTQIDRKGNTPQNNGLIFAKETYLGKKYAGYVELQTIQHIIRGERVRDLFRKLHNELQ